MNYKKLGLGLGVFSIALGAIELLGATRITRAIEADGHEGLVKAFGAREIVAGLGLLAAPANASGVWNRVAGDGMDLAALSAAAAKAPRNRSVWAALAFVVVATVIDVLVARGLDRTTGKTFPITA